MPIPKQIDYDERDRRQTDHKEVKKNPSDTAHERFGDKQYLKEQEAIEQRGGMYTTSV